MSKLSRDGHLAVEAAKIICDSRNIERDRASILVTLDHLIATMLIACMGRNPKMALQMLHEGTVPMVEERIMKYDADSKGGRK